MQHYYTGGIVISNDSRLFAQVSAPRWAVHVAIIARHFTISKGIGNTFI